MTFIKIPQSFHGNAKLHPVESQVLWDSVGGASLAFPAASTSYVFGKNNLIYKAELNAAASGDREQNHYLTIDNAKNADYCLITVAMSVAQVIPDPYNSSSSAVLRCSVLGEAKRGSRANQTFGPHAIAEDGASYPAHTKTPGYQAAGAGHITSSIVSVFPPFLGLATSAKAVTVGIEVANPYLLGSFDTETGDTSMVSFEVGKVGPGVPLMCSGLHTMHMNLAIDTPAWGGGTQPTKFVLTGKIIATLFERRGDNNSRRGRR